MTETRGDLLWQRRIVRSRLHDR